MRKLILITAFVLVSASAQAGISRRPDAGIDDPSATAEQSKAAEAPTICRKAAPSIRQQSGQNPQENSQSLQQSTRLQQGAKDAAAGPDHRSENTPWPSRSQR